MDRYRDPAPARRVASSTMARTMDVRAVWSSTGCSGPGNGPGSAARKDWHGAPRTANDTYPEGGRRSCGRDAGPGTVDLVREQAHWPRQLLLLSCQPPRQAPMSCQPHDLCQPPQPSATPARAVCLRRRPPSPAARRLPASPAPGAGRAPLTAADGYIADGEGLSPFATDYPAVGNLAPDLLAAVQHASTDAARDGVDLILPRGGAARGTSSPSWMPPSRNMAARPRRGDG